MTQISRDDVLHLAQLSRLQLDDYEVEALAIDLTNILGYVKQLDELDTENAGPSYQVNGLKNVWREDVTNSSDVSRDALLALAPDTANYQVKVLKVL